MVRLDWHVDDDGFAAPGYRIRPLRGHGAYRWRLESTRAGSPTHAPWSQMSDHRSLATAQFRAGAVERERIRSDRSSVRTVLGVGAVLVGVGAVRSVTDPIDLIVAVTLFSIGMRWIAMAIAIRFGVHSESPEDWRYDTSVLDRLSAPLVRSIRARARPVDTTQPAPRVRVLPPDLPGRPTLG